MTRLLALYPGWWRARYGDEMRALLEEAPVRSIDRADLVRGAIDAWLHPPVPSHIPGLAALLGGGLWTVAAVGVIAQPVPPDWPGYVLDVLLLALASVACLLVAVIGIAIRAADAAGRSLRLVAGVAVAGYLTWIVALGATAGASVDGFVLGAAQALAMVATAAIGAVLIRAGDGAIGSLVVVAAGAMLVP